PHLTLPRACPPPPSLVSPSCLHPPPFLALGLPLRRNAMLRLVAAGPPLKHPGVRGIGYPGRRHPGDLDDRLVTGLGQGHRARAAARPPLPPHPPTPAPPPPPPPPQP